MENLETSAAQTKKVCTCSLQTGQNFELQGNRLVGISPLRSSMVVKTRQDARESLVREGWRACSILHADIFRLFPWGR